MPQPERLSWLHREQTALLPSALIWSVGADPSNTPNKALHNSAEQLISHPHTRPENKDLGGRPLGVESELLPMAIQVQQWPRSMSHQAGSCLACPLFIKPSTSLPPKLLDCGLRPPRMGNGQRQDLVSAVPTQISPHEIQIPYSHRDYENMSSSYRWFHQQPFKKGTAASTLVQAATNLLPIARKPQREMDLLAIMPQGEEHGFANCPLWPRMHGCHPTPQISLVLKPLFPVSFACLLTTKVK